MIRYVERLIGDTRNKNKKLCLLFLVWYFSAYYEELFCHKIISEMSNNILTGDEFKV